MSARAPMYWIGNIHCEEASGPFLDEFLAKIFTDGLIPLEISIGDPMPDARFGTTELKQLGMVGVYSPCRPKK